MPQLPEALPYSGRHSEDTWIVRLAPDFIKDSQAPTKLPPLSETKIQPNSLIEFLSHHLPGWGAIYPIHRDKTIPFQRQHLRIAATKHKMNIKIHEFDSLNLLVERSSDEETETTSPRPRVMNPIEINRWQLAKTRAEQPPILPEEEQTPDYKAYINAVVDVQADLRYGPGSGVLVPITHKGIFYCQTRLHQEARIQLVRIKTRAWDSQYILAQWKGWHREKLEVPLNPPALA